MKVLTYIFIAVTFAACVNQERPVKGSEAKYFDLAGYFNNEITRLNRAEARVDKTVSQNDEQQHKTSAKINWKNELQVFVSSDINKPAWRDSYKIEKTPNKTVFSTLDTTLKTQRVEVGKKANGAVESIVISNRTDNSLYSSTEELAYYPDSIYMIAKDQHIIIIGNNKYRISGKIITARK